jgi:uncharacterized membrane protein (DUF485 family)
VVDGARRAPERAAVCGTGASERSQGEDVVISDSTEAVMANPKYQELVRARRSVAWTLTIIMWVAYFSFILLVAFNKTDGQIISAKVGGGVISIAIVAGVSLLVFSFLLTAIYVVIANSKFDRLTAELRREIGQ